MEVRQDQISHWGSYDAVDHGYDARRDDLAAAGMGALGQSPAPFAIPAAGAPDLRQVVAPEVRGRLQYVRSDLQQALQHALGFTAFHPTGGGGPGQVGTVVPLLGAGEGTSWTQAAALQGNAVLLNLASVQTGQPQFRVVGGGGSEVIVAQLAGVGGPEVIVSIGPQLEAAAQGLGVTPPLPQPWAPGPSPVPATASTPIGAVLLVAGGVVGVGAILYFAGKALGRRS